jgi:cell division protein FtsB
MMMKRNTGMIFFGLLVAAHMVLVSAAAAQEVKVDSAVLEKLQELIKQQQQQMQKQAEELKSLQNQVNDLKKTATEAQTQATEAKSTAQQAADTAKQAAAVQPPVDKVVTSGQERVKLAISGQTNRAVNMIDDGKNTTAYFVDNDVSNSRVRFVGTAKATDDLTIGTRIEVAIAPDESGDVNQDNESPGNFFDQRWAEGSLTSKRFGKLSLGKGDTASNNSAEVDLSRTDVVQYASIADIAAGMLFRQTGDDTLTDVSISDAFKDFDGLSRRSRARYDTPTFWGFHLAGSAVSDQRWDASLWWSGQGYGFKAAGAAAIAEPNQDNADYQFSGSFSTLHEGTGLNLTLSGGMLQRDGGVNDAANLYAKAGWLTRFWSFGQTAFGVDYTRSLNLPTNRDDGYSVGVAAVQQFENFGTEFYLQYRLFDLDRDAAPGVQQMHVGTVGARVKF